jgi:hypothetical protein
MVHFSETRQHIFNSKTTVQHVEGSTFPSSKEDSTCTLHSRPARAPKLLDRS